MTLLAVACEGADVLALFDTNGTPKGEIPIGRNPVHLVAVNGQVFVATMGERSVTVIDRDGNVDRIDTGVLGPAHLVPAGDRLLVPCTAGDVVAVIDPEARRLERRVSTGAEPHDIAIVGADAIAGSRTDGVLTVFDPATGTVHARHEVSDPDRARIQGVDATPNDAVVETAYAIDQGNGRVLAVRRDGIWAGAAVGTAPYEATVTADRVYVPAREADTVHELDLKLSTIEVHSTRPGPEGVVVIDEELWVFHRSTPVLCTLGGRDVSLPAPVLSATALPDGRLLCSHYDDDAISMVDLTMETVQWTAETPSHPFGAEVV